jgi:Rod binding protein
MMDAIPSGILQPLTAAGFHRASSSEEVRAKLWQKAVEFEGMYITQMMKPMFEGTQAEAPFGAGNAEDVWRSFELEAYGKAISRAGGIGLAGPVYRELLAIQEGKGNR